MVFNQWHRGPPQLRSTICMRKKRLEERLRRLKKNLLQEKDSDFPRIQHTSTADEGMASQDTGVSAHELSSRAQAAENDPSLDFEGAGCSNTVDSWTQQQNFLETENWEEGSLEDFHGGESEISASNVTMNDCTETLPTIPTDTDLGDNHESDPGFQSKGNDQENVTDGGIPMDTNGYSNGSEFEDCHQTTSKVLGSKVCRCTDSTVGDVVFMTLALGLRHKLTWEAQVDILKMLRSIHGVPDIPRSKKAFMNIINDKEVDLTYHNFCCDCEIYLGKRDQTRWAAYCYKCRLTSEGPIGDSYLACRSCNITLCSKLGKRWIYICPGCTKDVKVKSPSNFFVTLSIEQQLQLLLKDKEIAEELLSHRFDRKKKSDSALEDIYDGMEYKRHFDNGAILSSPLNFSMTFFTDGVPTGKNTGKSIWPVYMTLNELSYKKRNERTMLCGLYIGKKDPNQLLFLRPFVEEVNKLATEGFNWTHNGEIVNSKVIPLCGVFDSQARWQVLNMQSFHAFFGCTYCYQEQQRTTPGRRRFDMNEEAADERTPESTRMDADIAHQRRHESKPEDRVYRGVRGPSILLTMLYFNVIWGAPVDYMHALLMGIVKTHMKFLFESNRKKMWMNVTDRTAVDVILSSIDSRLGRIQPPTCITRVPRSIKMWKIWKASEWRSWILFYCIPCLAGLLKEKYLVHIAMLSRALSLLLQQSVELEEVDEAHQLFLRYGSLFQKYFDSPDTIYNLHLLTHIKKCVLNFGPLWTHSAFGFEGQNRHLLQLLNSPNNVLLQVSTKYIIYSSMQTVFDKLVTSFKTIEFAEQVLDKGLINFVRANNAVLIGTGKPVTLSPEELNVFAKAHGASTFSAFDRMLFKGVRYTTAAYAEGKQNNDSFVVCNRGVVQILRILLLHSNSVVILGRKVKKSAEFIVDVTHVTITHVRQVSKLGRLVCIGTAEIKCQSIVMEPQEGLMYVTPMPFGCHGD